MSDDLNRLKNDVKLLNEKFEQNLEKQISTIVEPIFNPIGNEKIKSEIKLPPTPNPPQSASIPNQKQTESGDNSGSNDDDLKLNKNEPEYLDIPHREQINPTLNTH